MREADGHTDMGVPRAAGTEEGCPSSLHAREGSLGKWWSVLVLLFQAEEEANQEGTGRSLAPLVTTKFTHSRSVALKSF